MRQRSSVQETGKTSSTQYIRGVNGTVAKLHFEWEVHKGVYVLDLNATRIPVSRNLTHDMQLIYGSRHRQIVKRGDKLLYCLLPAGLPKKMADEMAWKAIAWHDAAPVDAAQKRSSALPAKKQIKVGGVRSNMGNTSSDPGKGAAGPYWYMSMPVEYEGQQTSLMAHLQAMAKELCRWIEGRGGVIQDMLRHGFNEQQKDLQGSTGEGLIPETCITVMGISVAPDFANQPHVDKGDSTYGIIIWVMLPPAGQEFPRDYQHPHPFVGGEFHMDLGDSITVTLQPRHGTVLGLNTVSVIHHSRPITAANGWTQIGIGLAHKRSTITGCRGVFQTGQQSKIHAKQLGSKLPDVAAEAIESAGMVLAAIHSAKASGKDVPDTLLQAADAVSACAAESSTTIQAQAGKPVAARKKAGKKAKTTTAVRRSCRLAATQPVLQLGRVNAKQQKQSAVVVKRRV